MIKEARTSYYGSIGAGISVDQVMVPPLWIKLLKDMLATGKPTKIQHSRYLHYMELILNRYRL